MKAILLSVMLLAGTATLGWSAQETQAPAAAPKQQDVALSAEGVISRVDVQKQLLWIKIADGSEMQFNYTKDTPVEGGSNSVEGLTGPGGSGTNVRIQYENKGVAHMATKIEIQPAKS